MSDFMNIKEASEEKIYQLTLEDLQFEAEEYLGRELTDDEVIYVKDKLHYAISENLMFIYPAIFDDLKSR